jgi:hypothetical protein
LQTKQGTYAILNCAILNRGCCLHAGVRWGLNN